MIVAVASLTLGLVLGYLGQRSRLCFISGYRDWFLARDTTFLRGIVGAFLGAVGGFVLFRELGGIVPAFPQFAVSNNYIPLATWIFLVVGGLGVGIVGVLSGGCPFRMHVLAFEGNKTYWVYLAGFYLGLIFYNLFTAPVMQLIAKTLK